MPRYVPGPWIVNGTRYYTVWDIQTGTKHESSAAWKSERFAQEDADEFNKVEEMKGMQKGVLVGEPIRIEGNMIVMQEDNAVATYSRSFYRLPTDQDHVSTPIAIHWTDKLPVKMTYGLHGILAPVKS